LNTGIYRFQFVRATIKPFQYLFELVSTRCSAAQLFILIFFFCLIPRSVFCAAPPGYYLVWSDEFDGAELDSTKWYAWAGPNRDGVNTPGSVSVSGGNLVVTTYTDNGVHYTGILSSDGRFWAKYGYIEGSLKMVGAPGMWSGFWLQSPMMGAYLTDTLASGTEMDICEQRVSDAAGANISDKIQSSVHWDWYGANHYSATSGLVGSGLGTGFHAYGVLWSPTNYDFMVDGTVLWRTNVAVSGHSEVLLLSSEVHNNNWAGTIPPGGYGNQATSSTKMYVDYIRYYAPTSTVFWTGAVSGDWTDPANWVEGMVPKNGDDVQFGCLGTRNSATTMGSGTPGQNFVLNSLSIMETSPFTLSGNTLTLNAGGLDMYSAAYDASVNCAVVLATTQNWNIAQSRALAVNGSISGAGGLTKRGLGSLGLFGGSNLFTGTTTIKAGTFTTMGTMAGPLKIEALARWGPGISNSVPTIAVLTLHDTLGLDLGSTTAMDINKSTGVSDQIICHSNITYAGTLEINNLGGALAAGDSFKLFEASSYSGQFSRVSPGTPGPNLEWSTASLPIDGTLRVISAVPTNIVVQRTNSFLDVSWPFTHTGWRLQTQINPQGVGLRTNWVDIAAASATNRIVYSANSFDGSGFFRLTTTLYQPVTRFVPGDLAVLQVGNGVISSSGAPGVIVDFPTWGGPSPFQASIPSSGSSSLLFGGSSYSGTLSLSADGRSLVFAGYNIPTGSYASSVDTSSSSTVPRAVGSMNASGACTLQATTTQFSGNSVRSAAGDGNGNFWAGGGNSGIVYVGNKVSARTISSTQAATRNLTFINGNLHFTTTSTARGVFAFVGGPTSAAAPALKINTDGIGIGTPSPKGFAVNTNLTIAYVSDNRTAASGGGLQRFNWNGSSWAYAYSLPYRLSVSQSVWDIAVDFNRTNPVIYATTGESSENHLVTITDTGTNSVYTLLQTAPAGTMFRGVAWTPRQ
jgi:beta-glucanase (GH16 family)